MTKAKWCEDADIDGIRVKLLLVNNEAMRSKKELTIRKHAEKEKEELEAKLKKLFTHPCKCRADAEKSVAELEKKLKYCRLSDISYQEILKQAHKGRPAKNEQKIVDAVKITAKVTINEEEFSRKVDRSVRYVIATTDVKRKWTAAELIGVYKKQSVIERSWRFMKSKKLMVDALYLQKPSRITALMWLMTIALLIFSAMEYKIRQVMQENNLTIPTLDHRKPPSRPTMQRLFQYISNSSIHLIMIRQQDQIEISGLTRSLIDLINALGRDWATYFLSATYRAEPGEDF